MHSGAWCEYVITRFTRKDTHRPKHDDGGVDSVRVGSLPTPTTMVVVAIFRRANQIYCNQQERQRLCVCVRGMRVGSIYCVRHSYNITIIARTKERRAHRPQTEYTGRSKISW